MSIMVGVGRGARAGVLIKRCRGAGGAGEGRHAGGRQDRHADRGQAAAGRPCSRRRAGTRTSCCDWRRAWSGAASIRWRRRSSQAAEERGARRWRRRQTSSRSPARGFAARVDGRTVALGNRAIDGGGRRRRRRRWRARPRRCGATGRRWCSWRSDGRLAGLLGVADPIKASTPEAIRQLQRTGLRIVMLTGDNRTTAEAVAAEAGDRRGRGRGAARRRRTRRCGGCRQQGRSGGDGRRRHQRRPGAGGRPTWASPWAPAPMWRWRAPASRWSRATCGASCEARAAQPRDDAEHPPEPVLRLHLQRAGRPDRGGRAVPVLRHLLLSPMIAAAAMSFSSVSVISNALRLRTAALSTEY